jgi:hypothetical protein
MRSFNHYLLPLAAALLVASSLSAPAQRVSAGIIASFS